jgi:hypothetical protein
LALAITQDPTRMPGFVQPDSAADSIASDQDRIATPHPAASVMLPGAAPPQTAFYMIVADHNLRVFSVEGPMTDDRPWQTAALRARDRGLHIVCGPSGPDPNALTADFRSMHNLVRLPPGSIVRPLS